MGWQIHGTSINLETGDNGLHLSGECEQFPSIDLQLSAKKNIPYATGVWSIYKASRAKEAASLISLNVKTMKRLVTPEMLHEISKPISLIKFYSPSDTSEPPFIGFSSFLPEIQFEEVWRLATLLVQTDRYKYRIDYGFAGFVSVRYDEALLQPDEIEHPERKPLAYPDWLEGAPAYSNQGFTFRLMDRAKSAP